MSEAKYWHVIQSQFIDIFNSAFLGNSYVDTTERAIFSIQRIGISMVVAGYVTFDELLIFGSEYYQ